MGKLYNDHENTGWRSDGGTIGTTGFGLASVSQNGTVVTYDETLDYVSSNQYLHHVLVAEGPTIQDAWGDFFRVIKNLPMSLNCDIYWRRMPELTFNSDTDTYSVRARFTLDTFTRKHEDEG